ncbi:glycosyl transferase family 92 [Rhizobium sp. PP-F2F-G36]|nr:glycosyl transferase family 92 [Rhizobium sp. PP-F2F-G36]
MNGLGPVLLLSGSYNMFGWKSKRSFTRELVIVPPVSQADRHGIAIMACVKNEAPYIEEWVRFHRAIGVRHFHIYDDGSTDGTMDILRSLLSAKALTIVPWIMRMRDEGTSVVLNGQAIAFAHALLNFGGRYDWMAFIDVDEFLLPRRDSTLEDALRHAKGFPNISLPWHMFGHGGHRARPKGPVCLSYTARVAHPERQDANASNFKCIVDPTRVTGVSVHRFRTKEFGDRTSNDAGIVSSVRDRKAEAFYSAEYLQLNHYYLKSEEELSEKVARGWSFDDTTEKYIRKVAETARYIEHDVVEDRSMVAFIEQNNIDLGSSAIRSERTHDRAS